MITADPAKWSVDVTRAASEAISWSNSGLNCAAEYVGPVIALVFRLPLV
ncbi:hypothetical protein [Frigoribacterium sp. NBH87]|nr:hypothetical protein [Frigoribacterium sp. NBH87]